MTWRERIQAARERGAFTREDCRDASRFNTCAVAEQVANGMPIKMMNVNVAVPEDEYMIALGYDFYWKGVEVDDFDAAERTLGKIEDHALALKREARA